MLHFRPVACSPCFLLLLFGAPLQSQETRGQIAGRVVDPDGAVIVNAGVQAINTATNVRTIAQTNDHGDYILPFLIPGRYRVTIEMQGFRTFTETVTVAINDKLTLNAGLTVGSVSDSVDVVANAGVVDLSGGSAGHVVDSQAITELPMKDGNPAILAILAPGVMNEIPSGWSRPFDLTVNQSPGVSGVPKGSNEFTMDGAPNTARNFNAYVPPPGVVEEFKVQTATFDASYGFTPGATINMSLKSGTNNLHGQAYEFLQNPKLNANKFFANRSGLPRAEFRSNRFGINANGPVYIPRLFSGKDRTFWMYGYEGIHSSDPRGSLTQAVPTETQKNGDFSGLLALGSRYQIYDPATTTPAGNGRFSRLPLAGNVIPANRLNATARKIAGYWDPPNQTGTADGTGNWGTVGPEWDRYFNHIFRVDHNFSQKHRVFWRGNGSKRKQQHDARFNEGCGTYLLLYTRGLAFDDVYIFNPQFLVNTRYSYTRYSANQLPLQIGTDLLGVGFSKTFVDQIRPFGPLAVRLPRITVSGYGSLGVGPSNNDVTYFNEHNDTHDFAVNFTRVLHAHTIRFGTAYRVLRENMYNLGQSSGSFTFSTNWTRGPFHNSVAAPMGQSMASFLLGLPTAGIFPINDSYAEQSSATGLYVQDDWKISSRLTLSFGLRYELEQPITERYNRSTRGFDFVSPNPIQEAAAANYALKPIPEIPASAFRVSGGVTFAGANGLSRALWSPDKNNFMPRIGLAYALTPRTVLRGGYGVFFDQLGLTRQHVNQTGFSRNTDMTPTLDNGQTFTATITNPFPSGFDRPRGAQLGLATSLGGSVDFYQARLLTPYIQRWQVAIGRELPLKSSLQVAYFGSRGTKLLTSREWNPVPRQYQSTSAGRDQAAIDYLTAAVPNPFAPLLPRTSLAAQTVARSQMFRPYPEFISITSHINQGYSWYHSMQTVFQKRFTSDYVMSVVWTWGKYMEATSYLNETDPVPEKVISALDRTNRVVVTGLWKLPVGRGRKLAGSVNPVLDRIVGGWQIQGIYQMQSGVPFGFGNSILLGDITKVPLPKGQRSLDRWFNTSMFERDTTKQLARNIRAMSTRFSGVRTDGINQWDLSATKNTPLHEGTNLQFRAEFINAFNHVRFAGPNTNPANQNFGMITTEAGWPRTIQFGLKLLF